MMGIFFFFNVTFIETWLTACILVFNAWFIFRFQSQLQWLAHNLRRVSMIWVWLVNEMGKNHMADMLQEEHSLLKVSSKSIQYTLSPEFVFALYSMGPVFLFNLGPLIQEIMKNQPKSAQKGLNERFMIEPRKQVPLDIVQN